MAVTSFEVGALFTIDPNPAIQALGRLGDAFTIADRAIKGLQDALLTLGKAERVFDGLFAGVADIKAAVEGVGATAKVSADRMVAEFERTGGAAKAMAGEIEALNTAVGRMSRMGEGGILPPVGVGGRGGAGGLKWMERPGRPEFGTDEERANARLEDQDYEARRAYLRRQAEEEDRLRSAGGLYGPPLYPPGLWGHDDDWENAREENAMFNARRAAAERENAEVQAARERQAAMVGGAFGGVFKGMGPLVGALAPIGAEKAAMEEDRALGQVLQELGFSDKDERFPALMQQLRRTVRAGTEGTIISEAKGAKGLPGTAGQFGALFGTPEERLAGYEALLPQAMKFAEVTEQFHRGTYESSIPAAISYAHMTQRYGGPEGSQAAKEVARGLDTLFAITLGTKETVAAEQNILKYSVPIGKAAGLDPDETAALTGFFQMIGFSGTTAATGLGQMIQGLVPTGGPLSAQQAHRQQDLARAFTESLNLNPEKLHAVRKDRGKEHDQAMIALDLYDRPGHIREDVAPGGKLSRDAFLTHIEQSLSQHTPMQNLTNLRNAFTVRGERPAAMLEDPGIIEKLNTYIKNILHPPSVEQLQKESQDRPLSRFEQMLANLANIGNTLATQTLGPLNTALETTNTLLIGVNHWLQEHQGAATALGWGGLGLGIATAVGTAGAGALWLGRRARAVYRFARGLMPVAEAGADLLGEGLLGEGATAGGWSVAGLTLPLLGFGGAIAAGGAISGAMNAPMLDDQGRIIGTWGGGPTPRLPGQAPSPPTQQPTGQPLTLAPPAPPKIDIHLGPVTMNGVADQSTFDSYLKKVTDALRSALANSSGPPAGTPMSPYLTGGMP